MHRSHICHASEGWHPVQYCLRFAHWMPAFAGMTLLMVSAPTFAEEMHDSNGLGVSAPQATMPSPQVAAPMVTNSIPSYVPPAEGISQPSVPSPAAPVAPTASMPPLAPAGASSTPTPQNNLMQQLQKIMGKKANSDSVGQVIVIGNLLGCTQKTAGQDATNAFYSQMQATGKSIEAYCKQHQSKQARELLLKTLDENKDSPVVKAALTCYDAQQPTLASLGGPRIATDAANYAKWIRDPDLAKREVKESDICRGKDASSINVNSITVHP